MSKNKVSRPRNIKLTFYSVRTSPFGSYTKIAFTRRYARIDTAIAKATFLALNDPTCEPGSSFDITHAVTGLYIGSLRTRLNKHFDITCIYD